MRSLNAQVDPCVDVNRFSTHRSLQIQVHMRLAPSPSCQPRGLRIAARKLWTIQHAAIRQRVSMHTQSTWMQIRQQTRQEELGRTSSQTGSLLNVPSASEPFGR